MELEISSIAGTDKPDKNGTLKMLVNDATGAQHTLSFRPELLEKLFLAVATTKYYDPPGIPVRRFRPQGFARFRMGEDRGLSFLFDLSTGIHIMLSKQAAAKVQWMLDTFDDPETWNFNAATTQ